MFEITFDVLFVGAGPASLSAAYHLKWLIYDHNKKNPDKPIQDLMIGVLEKSSALGEHILSGAVIDPHVLDELVPMWHNTDIPIKSEIKKDDVYFLTSKGQFHFPVPPPGMENFGNYVLSLTEFVKWLGKRCEESGVEVLTSEPVKEIIFSDNGKVIGVKTGDKGVDKNGAQKGNYMPGAELGVKMLVVGEGSRGFITKKLVDKFNLDSGCNPQQFVTGVKELWEVKPEKFSPGYVTHTFGYPMDLKTFGGGFVYHLKDNLVALGLAIGLDYGNPELNLQEELQKFKMHPLIKKTIEGGKLVEYGAKTISEGGHYSIGKLSGDNFIIVGEGAGLLNSKKLKGIHLAIGSGIIAARVIFDAIKSGDYSAQKLAKYDYLIKDGWIGKELFSVRNFHQGFHSGLIPGMINTGLQIITGGRGLVDKFKVSEDYLNMKMISTSSLLSPRGRGQGEGDKKIKPDGVLTFDRPTDVYASGVKHEENQPCHLKIKDMSICTGKCVKEFGNPCTRFCPAEVYEIEEINDDIKLVGADPCNVLSLPKDVCPSQNNVRPIGTKKELKLNPSNCLHCKTCEIKDPYNNIEWTPPEGGGGPAYKNM